MPYYVLRYDAVVDDYVNRRAAFRPEHLRMAREAHERGELVMAGASGDPVDSALFVFHADSPDVAERFVASDPYVQIGRAHV